MSAIDLAVSLKVIKDVSDVVRNGVQTLAVIVAGVWSYSRFVRGRVFKLRADVQVDSELFGLDRNNRALQVRVLISNVGDAKIMLLPGQSLVDVEFLPAAKAISVADLARSGAWQPVPGGPHAVIPEQTALEGKEVVRDEIIVPLPPADSSGHPRAYRVTASLAAPAKDGRTQVWLGRSVIAADWE